jgi:trk system potassium uptake protein TrkA
MRKQFAVIGCGRFGASVAKSIYSLGYDVMAVDKSMEIIQAIKDDVTHAVQADITNELVLKELGLNNYDTVVIGVGIDLEASILAAITAKEVGVRYLVAKAQNDLHAKVLKKIGVDRIIFPERDMGERLASNLVSSNILDYIELSKDYSIMEINALVSWIGKNMKETNIREHYGLNILAVKREEGITISPNSKFKIQEGDILVAVGHNENFKKISDEVSAK